MDKHLSTTIRKARTSRIIDGPEGNSAEPGSAGADGYDLRNHNFHIVEDRDANGETRSELAFNQDALTLDDIPRIVAAEQAKEQRPNAYKHSRNQLVGSSGRVPKLVNGHQRDFTGGQEPDKTPAGESTQRVKKYFSELSALEYFIVRHVAVLSMEPLVEGFFNLEELLGLIESRKPTFWDKFGKAFRNDGRKTGKKKGVFGVSLDVLVERDGAESSLGVGPGALRVPAILDDTISAMRQMDMSVEGVFRKNSNIRRLKELAEAIDKENGDTVDLSKENPVQVAALLKKFLRELPDPLLTMKLHRLFITSQSKLLPRLLTFRMMLSTDVPQRLPMKRNADVCYILLVAFYQRVIEIQWRYYSPFSIGLRHSHTWMKNRAVRWMFIIWQRSSHQTSYILPTRIRQWMTLS